jgi:hypothetical protein
LTLISAPVLPCLPLNSPLFPSFFLQELSAEDVARRSIKIASDTCIYTNHNYVIETIDLVEAAAAEKVPAGDSASSAKDNKGEDKAKK